MKSPVKTLPEPALLKNLTADWVKNFSENRKEPPWLTTIRLEAFAQYLKLPFPDLKDEKWKRTNLSSIPWDQLKFQATASKPAAGLEDQIQGNGPALEPAVDGRQPARFIWDFNLGFSIQLSSILQKKGVEWMPLESAVRNREEKIRPAWEKAVAKAAASKFQSLLLALANAGTCLFIAKGAQIRTPLHQLFKGAGSMESQFLINFVFVEEEASLQIWEETVPADGKEDSISLLMTQTILELGANSNTQVFILQNWERNCAHFQFQEISQGADSRFNSVVVAMGGRIYHGESSLNVIGERAENKILGVLFGDENQNFENFINQNHLGRRTVSDIQFRGALKGESKSFFSGLIYIDPKAQQSDAYQSCKFLILSSGARADAIPNLEILADDVKCSHGAAVGPVDEEQKFYLETRGINPRDAEKIVVQGFVEPVIAAVPDPATQQRLRNFIEEKMER